MSSFVVNDNTLSLIASFISTQINHGFNNTGIYTNIDLKPYKNALQGGFYSDKEIFNVLLDENIKAVNGRYKDKNDTRETYIKEYGYKFKPVSIARIEHNPNLYLFLFRAISCYTYQLCEDATIDGEIYKSLEKIENEIARHFASEQADKIGAEWG